jgi:hypothetical protein
LDVNFIVGTDSYIIFVLLGLGAILTGHEEVRHTVTVEIDKCVRIRHRKEVGSVGLFTRRIVGDYKSLEKVLDNVFA